MREVVAFIVGILFALGLGLSGMTQPQIVRSFLDIFGHWDPRLMGVMAGAIGVHAILYRFIIKRKSPILGDKFHLPPLTQIDKKLVVGALIFGLGWGWTGICPGPGIVALISGESRFFYFIISMLIGMKIYQFIENKN